MVAKVGPEKDKTRTILEPQTNRVSKQESGVLSLEKPTFVIFATQKDFEKQFISQET